MKDRYWEVGPGRAALYGPPYYLHRTMEEVADQELLAKRDATDLATYRATLRKTTHKDKHSVADTNKWD